MLDILSDKGSVNVEFNDLQVTSAEEDAFKEMSSDSFEYCVVKNSTLTEHSPDSRTDNMPNLKVFLARKDTTEVEKSAKSYIGIIDECCDSLSTVESVLNTLYVKMEVGKNIDHLVVVGDGKTFDYLLKLKDENPTELKWMIPFPGYWHTLKNFPLMQNSSKYANSQEMEMEMAHILF